MANDDLRFAIGAYLTDEQCLFEVERVMNGGFSATNERVVVRDCRTEEIHELTGIGVRRFHRLITPEADDARLDHTA